MITGEQFGQGMTQVQVQTPPGSHAARGADEGRTGVVTRFLEVDGDPTGGVLITFTGGVSCAYANNDRVVVIGRPTGGHVVGPWKLDMNPDPEWTTFYATGLLAARADALGWIIYTGTTSVNGAHKRNPEGNRARAMTALADAGVDVSALHEPI